MKKIAFASLILFSISTYGQTVDESAIKQLFDQALTKGRSYAWLEHLSTKVGARLSGSPGAAAGVEWSRHEMENFADTVWLQPVMVPHWVRGQQEVGRIINSKKI